MTLRRRLEELEGAVLPGKAQVIHVVDTAPSGAGVDFDPDAYTFILPEALKGQTVTKAELDKYFPDAEVIDLVITYGDHPDWKV